MRKVLRPSRLICKAPLDVGPSAPGGDTVTEVMWGAHSGHRFTSASRCHASSSGASTSKTRLTVALVMNSTSSDWQPSTVGDGASRSMRQPIDDIAEGSPARYAWARQAHPRA
jgi:hypothetical protein